MSDETNAEPDHIANRDRILSDLRTELVGPGPRTGKPIDVDAAIAVGSFVEARFGRWCQSSNGEEIITDERPSSRYGVGVLHPRSSLLSDTDDRDNHDQEERSPARATEDLGETQIETFGSGGDLLLEDDDFDLTSSNARNPSSMALSFHVERTAKFTILVTGGRYEPREATYPRDGSGELGVCEWWIRIPVSFRYEVSAGDLRGGLNVIEQVDQVNLGPLDLALQLYSRPGRRPDTLLLTCALVNSSESSNSSAADSLSLFQAGFKIIMSGTGPEQSVLPYPEASDLSGSDSEPVSTSEIEEASLRLIYRKAKVYGVGHGCAANWDSEPGDRPKELTAECLPSVELPSVTADVIGKDGNEVAVPMATLAGVDGNDQKAFDQMEKLADEYGAWIDDRVAESKRMEHEHAAAALRHIGQGRRCLARMRSGIDLLRRDTTAKRAFQLANHAILLQQIPRERKDVEWDDQFVRLSVSDPEVQLDPLNPGRGKGTWRGFQIAFLLMCLESAIDGKHADREEVELIWFPTGGGKTEAYLALAAFAIFYRYLTNPEDHGVHVLMRYTLRLLTAQQFQRACRLICAMDHLRQRYLKNVEDEISIGIWVGGTTTPNTRRQAIESLKDLRQGRGQGKNGFLITECPWCGCPMGPTRFGRKNRVLGYEQADRSVKLRCPNRRCDFHSGLPVVVVDEDIYERRPDLVIGTVDKFAMLSWRPEARGIFGIDAEGIREVSPPGLIIQDELHLISGPLGSMVGLFEPLIEELCVDHRSDPPVRPKIVSSTATIRRYEDQIRSLYAREKVTLFPPPGLEAGDSFFARYARTEDGSLERGKIYVGVSAPGLGSVQTAQVRSMASLLSSPVMMSDKEADPWWTLLCFYNSLRELGGALSLFHADIPERAMKIKDRFGREKKRFLDYVLELTGRIRDDEVPLAIERLMRRKTGSEKPVDACLASNIIEVGVDIDRLSLMCVVGQPKTTSQYIQVTGRVGRKWWERPGLVVTIFSPLKPRDHSHFEKFKSYHERLYAQVEPTSVTPFSPPAIDRALHAVLIAYVRQSCEMGERPYPVPEDALDEIESLLISRVRSVDPDEEANVRAVLKRRRNEWRKYGRTTWEMSGEDPGLMYRAGSYVREEYRHATWAVNMSMRNVDAECRLNIHIPM